MTRAVKSGAPVARAVVSPTPPQAEQAFGMATYLTPTRGIGGRLRDEVEDFAVIEVGEEPRPRPGPFTAARIRLRNWETNRFAGRAARELRLRPKDVGFAGMKDKRAVTEQWFTFRCAPERLQALRHLQDVELVGDPYATDQKQFTGAHGGNRFVLRVRGARSDAAAGPDIASVRDAIAAQGGVPNFFGPQRFGSSVRPVTPRIGHAIVAGDLEEAVRLFVGEPFATEPDDVQAARRIWQDARDAEAALAAMPPRLDLERGVLARLAQRPGDWRHALHALPHNLLQLFVHSWQSLVFNRIVSARLDAGLGLATAHDGDLVVPAGGDGTATAPVTAENAARVQRELDRGRAFVTAPLPGLDTPSATGTPGEIEAAALAEAGIEAAAFRCRELPEVASLGRRRQMLMPVPDLAVDETEGDPVFSFTLERGAYATVVMREFLKTDVGAY